VQIHYEGNKWEGDGPWKSRLFWAPKMARCHFTGSQKVFISRAQPPPISTSITCENCYYIFLPALFKRKLNLNFLLASLKTLTYFKTVPKATSNFCSGFPSLSFVDLLQCTFMALEQFSGSQAAFGTIFRVKGSYRSFLKRVFSFHH
jgi:hypothetical protein